MKLTKKVDIDIEVDGEYCTNKCKYFFWDPFEETWKRCIGCLLFMHDGEPQELKSYFLGHHHGLPEQYKYFRCVQCLEKFGVK